MKRFILTFLFLVPLILQAQKVSIKVTQTKNKGLSDVEILDKQNSVAFSASEYLQNDSIVFSLDADNYYFLKINVPENSNPDTVLLILSLNGEPILYIKGDIGAGDHLLPFFTGVRQPYAKITGGTDANISDYPWQVYFISGNFRCGGSIISNKWVVTAAHCTKTSTGSDIPASSMFVRVGLDNPSLPNDGKEYSVTQVIVHEGFNDQTLLNDIALLRIKDSINFTNAVPIKLISAEDVDANSTAPGVMTWVTGWGYTHVNPNVIPTSLQKVQLPIISNQQASTVWKSIPATDMMAGFLNGNKDACNGDSGGPLVVPVFGEYKLAGIVSWGSSNCDTYGAYTRVSDFLDWIKLKTGITTDFKPSKPVGDSIICEGVTSAAYSVSPYTGASSYEWRVFPETAGSVSGSSTSASVVWNPAYFGSFNVIVRVTAGGKVSDWSRLDGNKVVNTRILSQSTDTIMCAGGNVTLKVNTVGYNLKFTWFKDGQVYPTNNTSKLIFTNAKAGDSGDYKVEASSFCGTVTSEVMHLTVYAVTKVLSLSPDAEVAFHGTARLVVNAEGHDLNYVWQKDGFSIANSNTPSLTLNNVNAADIGVYKVTVTGTCGTTISDTIYLYIKRSDYSADPQVFVWPSLTAGEFSVALNNDDYYNVRIYSTSGTKVMEKLKCRYQTRLNIVNLASGLYIVEVFNADFRKSVKIIRE